VVLQRNGSVGIMVWQNEEQNRFTTPFLQAIEQGLAELAADDDVRGVVLTSALPRCWCTGLHLAWLLEESACDPDAPATFLELLHRVLLQLTGFPKPVVAALNGHAMGGGAIVAAACDYRLMRKDRGFVSLPAVKLSIPFSPGVIALLQATLPAASFRELAYTGDRFTSARARELGFIDELHSEDELLPKAVALASRLGEARPSTFAQIKLGLRRTVLETMRRDDPPALERTLAAITGS